MVEFQKSDATFYHNGNTQNEYARKNRRAKPPEHIDRKVIAWDMEGISLSGQNRPQHPVLFGCSAEVDNVLESEKLTTKEMLEYMISVAEKNPHSIHVGYAFKYDANMILQSLPKKMIEKIWENGTIHLRFDEKYQWAVRWIPGKMFTLSRRPQGSKGRNSRAKVSMTVYDYSSFFGKSFIEAAEQILAEDLTADDYEVIAHGKAARGNQSWEDMPEIRHYWSREIVLIQRVFEKFRDVMYRAGFPLKEWYGPGALANFINTYHNIRPKLAGVQSTSDVMPNAVHEASKVAFVGGRFELFQSGRVKGPIYAIDINSAYPYALTKIPSFAEDSGEWVRVEEPDRIERFGFYRVEFQAPKANPIEYRPMPFPWRDNRGMISYPNRAHGWYASPEAAIALKTPGARVAEGWYWRPHDTSSVDYPWGFLQDMFDRRMQLGKKNLLSMPFKLGPNSLYGKYAQTVGWDKEKNLPPKSHALPVAAWITSYCRAMLWRVMAQAPDKVVAVETDSVFMTVDPSKLDIDLGDGLGQWDYTVYDELVYLQSGMYHYKQDGEWKGTRSRGINASEYTYEQVSEYLSTLEPGEDWHAMQITTKPRFMGAGAALSTKQPFKHVWCSWRPQTKEMALGNAGKRVHSPKVCSACSKGESPNDVPHRLFVSTRSDGEMLSKPRRLPWESPNTPEVQQIKEKGMIDDDKFER